MRFYAVILMFGFAVDYVDRITSASISFNVCAQQAAIMPCSLCTCTCVLPLNFALWRGTSLFIILCLGVPELSVLALRLRHQRLVRTLLYELPAVEHGDGITEPTA